MDIIDDLTAKATDAVDAAQAGLSGMVNGIMGGSAVDTVLGMTDLDEKAIAMFEEKVGAGKVAEIKSMLADGKMDKVEAEKLISEMAMAAGVSPETVAMVMKFI